jgi:hypothetical protein
VGYRELWMKYAESVQTFSPFPFPVSQIAPCDRCRDTEGLWRNVRHSTGADPESGGSTKTPCVVPISGSEGCASAVIPGWVKSKSVTKRRGQLTDRGEEEGGGSKYREG